MEMRRKDRRLEEEDTRKLLMETEYGTLSLISAKGEPYGVPMSYALVENTIYLHCTNAGGWKLQCMEHCENACFTVVNHVQLLPESFGTKYMSAIAAGKIQIVTDQAEKRRGIEAILEKYSAPYKEQGMKYIQNAFDKIHILKLDIVTLSGKGRV